MDFSLIKNFNEKLFVKVFVLLMGLIFFISISFTALFVRNQANAETQALIKNGMVLVKVFADTSVIGVYSENRELLNKAVAGVTKVEGVLGVAVYNADGGLLTQIGRTPAVEASTINQEGFRPWNTPYSMEFKAYYVFGSPVVIKAGFLTDDALLFETMSNDRERIIGFINIFLDRKNLIMQVRALILKSILIWIIFLVIGSVVAFFLARGVTQPLYRLTEGVKTLGEAGSVQKISVETEDEIGRLAQAFNQMSESLSKRQSALVDSEKTLRFLSGQLFKAQEMERKRLSIELHDELGQGLALLKHRFRLIETILSKDGHSASGECKDTIQDIDQVIENVRRLSRDLSPSILEDLGLSAAISWLIERFQRRYNIQVYLDLDNIDFLFSIEEQTNIYRMFQEIFNNIGKHAEASLVKVCVKIEQDSVVFVVDDDGKGFDVEEAKNLNIDERGIGLAALDERANMLRGVFEIQSQVQAGTRIELKVPMTKAEA